MKKVLYTILSILSIIYIGFMCVDVIRRANPEFLADMGWFTKIYNFIVSFGGIAIIFCFALVNFAGSPLKTVFFILLIVAIICFIIISIVPDFFYNIFKGKETVESAVNAAKVLLKI